MNSIDRDALIKFIPQKYISEEKKRFTALDIFDFEGVLDADKVNTSIRLDLIEPEKLQEFACRCAERALRRVENPDPRSVAAIEAKRAWMKGEISDAELAAARAAAWDAERDAERDAAWAAAWDAAWAAAWAAARAAARDAAWAAARDAAWAAARAAASAAARAAASAAARDAAWDAASDAERAWQVEALKKMLRGGGNVKSITYEEFLEFEPCYLDDPKEKALMDSIAQRQDRWTALDILELKEIPDEDKLWCALREELIEPEKVHKFACRCAERALSRVEHPDPRSVAAIEAKRAWLRGEIADAELDAACEAAWDAARAAADTAYAAWDAARAAAWDAASAAASAAARDAARASARVAASAAASAAARDAARDAAWAAAWAAERAWQVEELKKMLREGENNAGSN